MSINLTKEELIKALSDAGSAHHDYEQKILKGVRDELWPGFYAAFLLGRLGDFTSSSILSELLENAPAEKNWAESAVEYVITELSD